MMNLFQKTVPSCQNIYKNSFTYHCLQDDQDLHFDDAIQFPEQCEKDRARVLVHCMSGKSRSPAIVIAYLMKSKGWKLAQSYQWVKDRRPSVNLNQVVYQQLQEYVQKIFGSLENQPASAMPVFSSPMPSLSFNYPKPSDIVQVPAFNGSGATSIFASPGFGVPPQEFTFGAAAPNQQNTSESDIAMDGS